MFTTIPRLNTPRSTFWLRSLLHRLPPISLSSSIRPHSLLHQRTVTMFSKAINTFEQKKPKPVTKSTSPSATRKVQQTKISPSGFLSRPTTLPTSNLTLPSVTNNIRNRTQNNLANHFNTEAAFQENISPPTEISTGSTNEDYVYYHPDDFDDDFDLDCDSPAPIKRKSPTPIATEPVYPIKADSYAIDLTSDAPLEWPASSPPRAPKREEEELVPVPAPKRIKLQKPTGAKLQEPIRAKRTLPWGDNTPEVTQSVEVKAETKKSAAGPAWDSLAADKMSGAKAAMRRAGASKKDPESALGIAKIKSRPAGVFLSEEQKTVVKLVAYGKKSVFFTGSAGRLSAVALCGAVVLTGSRNRKVSAVERTHCDAQEAAHTRL